MSNTNTTKNRGWTQGLWKCKRSCSTRDTVVLLSCIYLIIIASNSNLFWLWYCWEPHLMHNNNHKSETLQTTSWLTVFNYVECLSTERKKWRFIRIYISILKMTYIFYRNDHMPDRKRQLWSVMYKYTWIVYMFLYVRIHITKWPKDMYRYFLLDNMQNKDSSYLNKIMLFLHFRFSAY